MRGSRVALITSIMVGIAVLAVLLAFIMPESSGISGFAMPTVSAEPAAEESEVTLHLPEISAQNVQAVIARLERVSSYSRVVTIERFWTGGSTTEYYSVWVSGENTRINHVTESGEVEKNILICSGADADEVYIWYSDDTSTVYTGAAASAGADAYQSLLTYEDVIELDSSAVTAGGYIEFNGEYCIYAQYIAEDTGYICRIYVSPSTGLLMGSEIYSGSVLVYTMSSSEINFDDMDESRFSAP